METQVLWRRICFSKWQPFDSFSKIRNFFALVGVIAIVLVVFIVVSYLPLEQHYVYYAEGTRCLGNQTQNNACVAQFELKETIEPPIFILYVLQNTYINHRKYLESFSPDQLAGKTIDMSTAKTQCFPIVTNKDHFRNVSYGGKPLDPEQIASPCGFKAFLYFNDTFEILESNGKKVPINETGIAIDRDDYGFFEKAPLSTDTQWIDPEDQHFIVWMQSQSLMTKKKLWGRIEQPLLSGKYYLTATNYYHIGQLPITKGIVVQTSSIIGGKVNLVLAAFIFTAILCCVYLVFISIRYRKLGDLKIE